MTDQNNKLCPPTLVNPFFAIEKAGIPPGARLNSVVPAETIEYLISIHPRPPGVIKYVVNIIYDKLIRELRRRGITGFAHQSDFLTFMRECEIGLPGEVLVKRQPELGPSVGPLPNSPTPGPMHEAAEPPNGRGTPPDHHHAPGTPGQPRPVQQPSQALKGERRRKGVAEGRSV